MTNFYIGCPMWGYKEWVGSGRLFPPRTPASDFLKLYSQKLGTVEGNTIFYAVPTAETIQRWVRDTPASFRFCPKVTRQISHEGRLDARKDETHIFTERMRGLGQRLGPMFLQLPPAFAPAQIAQLEAFLEFWPADLQLAVEVRHPDFFREPHESTLNTLLHQHQAARVLLDVRPIHQGPAHEQKENQARERKPDLPLHVTLTSTFAFVRYIGHPRMEVNVPFLESWAQYMGQWLNEGRSVYAFCHCPFEEHSPSICTTLYQQVAPIASLPPLAWERPAMPEQFRLF